MFDLKSLESVVSHHHGEQQGTKKTSNDKFRSEQLRLIADQRQFTHIAYRETQKASQRSGGEAMRAS